MPSRVGCRPDRDGHSVSPSSNRLCIACSEGVCTERYISADHTIESTSVHRTGFQIGEKEDLDKATLGQTHYLLHSIDRVAKVP